MNLKDSGMSRPNIYILERLLGILWNSNKEYKQTELQMAVCLNYRIYIKYLEWMRNKNLIAIKNFDNHHQIIKITEKGVQMHEMLSKIINEF